MNEALSIPEWIHVLQNELNEADRSAFIAQTELWKKFGDHSDFPQVTQEIYQGWLENRYLDWKVVELNFNIRPVSSSFFSRLGASFGWLIGKKQPLNMEQETFVLANSNDPKSIRINVKFEKLNGQIHSTYTTSNQVKTSSIV